MNNSKSDDELLIHFFEFEIKQCMDNKESKEFFNGVCVGNKKQMNYPMRISDFAEEL